jgi:uncharacterized phage protein (TIGR01671 family)
MEREIKFRAWNGSKMELNVMTGFLGAFYVQGMDEKDSACMSPFNTKLLPETPIMQYTGLKDKSGKEIYEGDILLNFGMFKRVCEFKQGSFGYEADANMGFISYNSNAYNLKITDDKALELEIIGNIYENPNVMAS